MKTDAPLPRLPMPDGIGFELEGDVSLADFERALKALQDLLDGLAGQVAPGSTVRWLIEDLSAGSATAVLIPEVETPEAERISEAYREVGQALEEHRDLPYKSATKGPVKALRQIIQGPVEAVVFHSKGVSSKFEDIQARAVSGRTAYVEAYGAVLGHLRSLTIPHTGLRGSITDMRGRSVRCYFPEDREEDLRQFWGKYVAVEGLVKRRMSTGDAVSISKVTNIEGRDQVGPGAWRDAIGIAPAPEGAPSSEEAVRRVRDG